MREIYKQSDSYPQKLHAFYQFMISRSFKYTEYWISVGNIFRPTDLHIDHYPRIYFLQHMDMNLTSSLCRLERKISSWRNGIGSITFPYKGEWMQAYVRANEISFLMFMFIVDISIIVDIRSGRKINLFMRLTDLDKVILLLLALMAGFASGTVRRMLHVRSTLPIWPCIDLTLR